MYFVTLEECLVRHHLTGLAACSGDARSESCGMDTAKMLMAGIHRTRRAPIPALPG